VELNWSTFILEIINFLVLVWILKRFLYKPVLETIARRREGIEKTLADAESRHNSAVELQEQYESRLTDWEDEKRQARDVLQRELDAQRNEKLEELQVLLEQERQKANVIEERRLNDTMRQMERQALEQGGEFATKLLQQAAGPELEARLVARTIEDLKKLPEEQIRNLRKRSQESTVSIRVTSAYELQEKQRQKLEKLLLSITESRTNISYAQSRDLLAGLEITIDSLMLGMNLRDELRGFTELVNSD
jgi:F-type H+-transporting ATPase subunit b